MDADFLVALGPFVLPLLAVCALLAAAVVVVRSKQTVARQQILSELVDTLERARAIDKQQAQTKDDELQALRGQLAAARSEFLSGVRDQLRAEMRAALLDLLPQRPRPRARKKATSRAN